MFLLESERLFFRDHEAGDFEAYFAIEADPEVRRYVGGVPRTREGARRKFRDTMLKKVSRSLALRAAVLKSERRYVGYAGIYPHLTPEGAIGGEAVLGFAFAREYWRRGLATEAGRIFIAHGFGDLQLKRILAVVEIGNAASVRVLEKLGFLRTATETVGVRSFYRFALLNAKPPD
jgi:RimJ/RimL family protein N-acetyltransferase